MLKNSRSEAGISLVSVLVLLALLSSIIVTFIYLNRDLIQSASNRVELTQARAEASGGYELGVHLIRSNQVDPRSPSNSLWSCRLADAIIALRWEDEAGKIDLNGASEDLLLDLIALYIEDQTEVERVVDLIIDYRDGDDIPRPNGAEFQDYQRDGFTTQPKNRPFELVDELYQISYLPSDLVSRISPNLTVYSRRSGIDPNYAPLTVLQAAAGDGFTDEELGIDAEQPNIREDLRQRIPVSRTITSPRQTYSLKVQVLRDSGFGYAEHIVFSMNGQERRNTLLDKSRIGFALSDRTELEAVSSTIEACIERVSDVP